MLRDHMSHVLLALDLSRPGIPKRQGAKRTVLSSGRRSSAAVSASAWHSFQPTCEPCVAEGRGDPEIQRAGEIRSVVRSCRNGVVSSGREVERTQAASHIAHRGLCHFGGGSWSKARNSRAQVLSLAGPCS